MGSLIFVVEDKIQNMELRFILVFAFLFAAVFALPGKKEKNMKWDDTSDEMEEDEIFQMDDAVNTVDDEPQENVEEMEGTVAVEGKNGDFLEIPGPNENGYRGRRTHRRKREANGKKGKNDAVAEGDSVDNVDDELQTEGEAMEGTDAVQGKYYGGWGYGGLGYGYGRRKRGAGKKNQGKGVKPFTGNENAEAEDDEPQAEGEEMEGTVSVEGKYGRRKREAGKKGKVGVAQPYTGNENAEAEDDEPQTEGEGMEGTVSVEGKYGRYYGRRKRGAGKKGKVGVAQPYTGNENAEAEDV